MTSLPVSLGEAVIPGNLCVICARDENTIQCRKIDAVKLGTIIVQPLISVLETFIGQQLDGNKVVQDVICKLCIQNFEALHHLENKLSEVKSQIYADLEKNGTFNGHCWNLLKSAPIKEENNCDLPKRFKCNVCYLNFNRERLLSKHLKDTHQGLTFKCNSCTETFLTQELLDVHIEFHNNDERRSNKATKSSTRTSKIVAKPKRRGRPPKSDKDVKNDLDTENNSIEETDEDSLKCKTCNECYENPEELKEHLQKKHRTLIICWDCELQFKNKKTYDEHFEAEHQVKTETNTENQSDGENSYVHCEVCDHFVPKQKLKEHLSSKHPSEMYKCDHCMERFEREKVFELHKLRCDQAQVNENSNSFICDFCDMDFDEKIKLALHLYSHCEINKYQCPKCTFTSNAKSSVDKHIENEVHIGEIKINGYMFKFDEKQRYRNIYEHMTNPYGGADKYYECKSCAVKFGEKMELLKHAFKKNHLSGDIIVHLKTERYVPDLNRINDSWLRETARKIISAAKRTSAKEVNSEAAVIAGVRYESRDVAIKLWCKESGVKRYECSSCSEGSSDKTRALRHAVRCAHNAECVIENEPLFDAISSNIGQSYKARYRKNSLDYLRNPDTQNARPCFGVKPELPLERLLFNNLKGTLKKPDVSSQPKPRILNMRRGGGYSHAHQRYFNPYANYGRKRKYQHHIELNGYEDEDDPGYGLDRVKAERNPDSELKNQNLGVLLQGENENGERVLMLEGNFQVDEDVNLYMDAEGNIISQDADGNCFNVMQAILQE